MCSLDPFAYVSHLSALEYHGLTDRFPQIVSMTRPPAAEWRKQAKERMLKDLGEKYPLYIEAGLPKLVRPDVLKIGQTSIQIHERSQMGAYRLVVGSSLRVATIGRTFLDMLREPALCGGWQHVIDIYRQEARRYLNLIVDEVNQHGHPIDKVRAGYVLSEVCGLESESFDDWQKCAQRGGSRKLDADGDYAPQYSERWKLSLNVPSVTKGHGDE
jgi:predicted transcriptional regulator of viral defense system